MPSIEHDADAQPSKPVGDAPVVQTPAGAVRGVMLDDRQAGYLGIPYAEPPVGPLRYAAPVKRAPWEDVRDASKYGATPLRAFMAGVTLIPEPAFAGDDTLNLNVYTPRPGDTSAKLPVYVWIHGGGFVSGSPSSSWYDGGAFARDGVVVVSVSYRLGFDGFGVIPGAPDNRALRDWILALEWVRDSIAEFGGDPERVTVGGQSAGGSAVLTLLATPSAQDLFSRVVAESPGAFAGNRAQAVAHTAALAKRLGIEPTREAFAALDEQSVTEAQMKMLNPGLGFLRGLVRGTNSALMWAPVVDGDLLPHTVEEAIGRGVGAGKELLIGATADEFGMVSASMPKALDRLPRHLALRMVGLDRTAARSFAAATSGKSRALFGSVLTDELFRFFVARILAARGGTSTYAYDFRFQSAGNSLAGHCIELPFAWDCLDGENVEANTGADPPQELADLAHGAWTAFIKGGDPGWAAYDTDSRQGMVFDRSSKAATVYTRETGLVRGRTAAFRS